MNRMANTGIKEEKFMQFKTKISQLAERIMIYIYNEFTPTSLSGKGFREYVWEI